MRLKQTVYDCNWEQQFNSPQNDYPESDQGFGGGDIGEATPWNAVVRKSRGTGDMRPIKHKSLNKNMSMSNRFACLQTQSNECDSVESDFPQLATSLDLVHNSPCHKQ